MEEPLVVEDLSEDIFIHLQRWEEAHVCEHRKVR